MRLVSLLVAQVFFCSTILPAWATPYPKTPSPSQSYSLKDSSTLRTPPATSAKDGGSTLRSLQEDLAQDGGDKFDQEPTAQPAGQTSQASFVYAFHFAREDFEQVGAALENAHQQAKANGKRPILLIENHGPNIPPTVLQKIPTKNLDPVRAPDLRNLFDQSNAALAKKYSQTQLGKIVEVPEEAEAKRNGIVQFDEGFWTGVRDFITRTRIEVAIEDIDLMTWLTRLQGEQALLKGGEAFVQGQFADYLMYTEKGVKLLARTYRERDEKVKNQVRSLLAKNPDAHVAVLRGISHDQMHVVLEEEGLVVTPTTPKAFDKSFHLPRESLTGEKAINPSPLTADERAILARSVPASLLFSLLAPRDGDSIGKARLIRGIVDRLSMEEVKSLSSALAQQGKKLDPQFVYAWLKQNGKLKDEEIAAFESPAGASGDASRTAQDGGSKLSGVPFLGESFTTGGPVPLAEAKYDGENVVLSTLAYKIASEDLTPLPKGKFTNEAFPADHLKGFALRRLLADLISDQDIQRGRSEVIKGVKIFLAWIERNIYAMDFPSWEDYKTYTRALRMLIQRTPMTLNGRRDFLRNAQSFLNTFSEDHPQEAETAAAKLLKDTLRQIKYGIAMSLVLSPAARRGRDIKDDVTFRIVLNAPNPVHADIDQKTVDLNFLSFVHYAHDDVGSFAIRHGLMRFLLRRTAEKMANDPSGPAKLRGNTPFFETLLVILEDARQFAQNIGYTRKKLLQNARELGGLDYFRLLEALADEGPLDEKAKTILAFLLKEENALLVERLGFETGKRQLLFNPKRVARLFEKYEHEIRNSRDPFVEDKEPPEERGVAQRLFGVPRKEKTPPADPITVVRARLSRGENHEREEAVPDHRPTYKQGRPKQEGQEERAVSEEHTASPPSRSPQPGHRPPVEIHLPNRGEAHYLNLLEGAAVELKNIMEEKARLRFFISEILTTFLVATADNTSTRKIRKTVQEAAARVPSSSSDEAHEFVTLIEDLMKISKGSLSRRENDIMTLAAQFRNDPFLNSHNIYLGIDIGHAMRARSAEESAADGGYRSVPFLYMTAHDIIHREEITIYNNGTPQRVLMNTLGNRIDDLDQEMAAYGFVYRGDTFGMSVERTVRFYVRSFVLPILHDHPSETPEEDHPINDLISKIVKKEFSGRSEDPIVALMLKNNKFHELQHLVDELTGRLSGYSRTDAETSAYLAAIALGPVPLTSFLGVAQLHLNPWNVLLAPAYYEAGGRILLDFAKELGLSHPKRALNKDTLGTTQRVFRHLLEKSPEELAEMARRIHARRFGPDALTRLSPEQPSVVEPARYAEAEEETTPAPVTEKPEPAVPKQPSERMILRDLVPAAQIIGLLGLAISSFLLIYFMQKPQAPPSKEPVQIEERKPSYPPLIFMTHTTGKDESLSSIATAYSGDPFRYDEIYWANKYLFRNPDGTIRPLPKDPKAIFPIYEGEQLLIPNWRGFSEPIRHRVRKGESFTSIARKYYMPTEVHVARMVDILVKANPGAYRESPDILPEGVEILVPRIGLLASEKTLSSDNARDGAGRSYQQFIASGLRKTILPLMVTSAMGGIFAIPAQTMAQGMDGAIVESTKGPLIYDADIARLAKVEAFGQEIHAGRQDIIDSLITAATQDSNDAVRRAALKGLGHVGEENPRAIRAAVSALHHSNPAVRLEAIWTLEKIVYEHGASVVDAVLQAASDEDPRVSRSAFQLLGKIGHGHKSAISTLAQAVYSQDKNTQRDAVVGLDRIGEGDEEALTALAEAVGIPDFGIYYKAGDILTKFDIGQADNTKAVTSLAETYRKSDDPVQRQYAVNAIRHVGKANSLAVATLGEAVHDKDERVSGAAIEALKQFEFGKASKVPAVQALIDYLQEHHGLFTGHDAGVTLGVIGHQDPFARNALLDLAKSKNPPPFAIRLLGHVSERGDREVISLAVNLLRNENLRSGAQATLERIAFQDEAAIAKVMSAFHNKQDPHRNRYLETLGKIGLYDKNVMVFMEGVSRDAGEDASIRELAQSITSDIQEAHSVHVKNVYDIHDLLEAPPPANADGYAMYRLGEGPIYILDFKNIFDQGRVLNRIAYFIEREGFAGRILRDAEMMDKALNLYGGHDYSMKMIAEFFNRAESENINLSDVELRLRNQLLMMELLVHEPGQGYQVTGDFALISITQDPENREMVLLHELSHGKFFTSPEYRQRVKEAFEALTPEQKTFVKAFLELKGYDVSNEDLLLTEYAAYFQDGQTLADMLGREFRSAGHTHEGRKAELRKQLVSALYHYDEAHYGGEPGMMIWMGHVKAKMHEAAETFITQQSADLLALLAEPENWKLERDQPETVPIEPTDTNTLKLEKEPQEVLIPSIDSDVEYRIGGVPMMMETMVLYQLELDPKPAVELKAWVIQDAEAPLATSAIKRRIIEKLNQFSPEEVVKLVIRGNEEGGYQISVASAQPDSARDGGAALTDTALDRRTFLKGFLPWLMAPLIPGIAESQIIADETLDPEFQTMLQGALDAATMFLTWPVQSSDLDVQRLSQKARELFGESDVKITFTVADLQELIAKTPSLRTGDYNREVLTKGTGRAMVIDRGPNDYLIVYDHRMMRQGMAGLIGGLAHEVVGHMGIPQAEVKGLSPLAEEAHIFRAEIKYLEALLADQGLVSQFEGRSHIIIQELQNLLQAEKQTLAWLQQQIAVGVHVPTIERETNTLPYALLGAGGVAVGATLYLLHWRAKRIAEIQKAKTAASGQRSLGEPKHRKRPPGAKDGGEATFPEQIAERLRRPFRLVVADLDDSLARGNPPEGEVPLEAQTKHLIRQLRSEGVDLAVVTGGELEWAKSHYVQELKPEDLASQFLYTSGGGRGFRFDAHGNLDEKSPVLNIPLVQEHATATHLMEMAKEVVDEMVLPLGHRAEEFHIFLEETGRWPAKLTVSMMDTSQEIRDNIANTMNQRLTKEPSFKGLKAFSTSVAVEVNRADKGMAVRHLVEQLKIDPKDVLILGDSRIDELMYRALPEATKLHLGESFPGLPEDVIVSSIHGPPGVRAALSLVLEAHRNRFAKDGGERVLLMRLAEKIQESLIEKAGDVETYQARLDTAFGSEGNSQKTLKAIVSALEEELGADPQTFALAKIILRGWLRLENARRFANRQDPVIPYSVDLLNGMVPLNLKTGEAIFMSKSLMKIPIHEGDTFLRDILSHDVHFLPTVDPKFANYFVDRTIHPAEMVRHYAERLRFVFFVDEKDYALWTDGASGALYRRDGVEGEAADYIFIKVAQSDPYAMLKVGQAILALPEETMIDPKALEVPDKFLLQTLTGVVQDFPALPDLTQQLDYLTPILIEILAQQV